MPARTLGDSKILKGRDNRQLKGWPLRPFPRVAFESKACDCPVKMLFLKTPRCQPDPAIGLEDLCCPIFGWQPVEGKPNSGSGCQGQHIHHSCLGRQLQALGSTGMG